MSNSNNSTHGIKLAVMLRRLSTMTLGPSYRDKAGSLLPDHVAQSTTALRSWIEERNLSGQIVRVEEFSAFDVLFIEGTQTLAQSLA